jgi:hypothetical protein
MRKLNINSLSQLQDGAKSPCCDLGHRKAVEAMKVAGSST